MYTIKFKVENGGNSLYSHEENIKIIGSFKGQNIDHTKETIFTSKECERIEHTFYSNEPFTIIKNIEYFEYSKDKIEYSQETFKSEYVHYHIYILNPEAFDDDELLRINIGSYVYFIRGDCDDLQPAVDAIIDSGQAANVYRTDEIEGFGIENDHSYIVLDDIKYYDDEYIEGGNCGDYILHGGQLNLINPEDQD